ncbi:MAG: hypothetical protein ACI89L_000453 [Phycisphaerales bacterium]|jgi:uncharacterized protein
MTEPQPPAPKAPQETPRPVTESHRHQSLDVIRGFALLGILGPNVLAFAWPSIAMYDPGVIDQTVAILTPDTPPHTAANDLAHDITSVFFFGKMMFLFSLLFGAGVVMYARKFEGRDLKEGWWLWYRRMGWLLAIGLTHAVLFWYGDILVWYAVAGMGALWWVRKWSPKLQLLVGIGTYLLGAALMTGLMLLWVMFMGQSEQGEQSLTTAMNMEIEAYTGTYLMALKSRVVMLLQMYLVVLPLGFFWMCSGIMMGGMALTRLGVLTGERSTRFYAVTAAIGLTVGLSGSYAAFTALEHSGFDNAGMLFQGFGQLIGIPTSLGYAASLILLLKLGVLRPLTAALAAVGRMALSNYLLQTIMATTIFYPHGLGHFGTVQYPELWVVMGGIWAFNIVFSLAWLRFFRFGPAEWLWRSLTYWQPQPMLRRSRG